MGLCGPHSSCRSVKLLCCMRMQQKESTLLNSPLHAAGTQMPWARSAALAELHSR